MQTPPATAPVWPAWLLGGFGHRRGFTENHALDSEIPLLFLQGRLSLRCQPTRQTWGSFFPFLLGSKWLFNTVFVVVVVFKDWTGDESHRVWKWR